MSRTIWLARHANREDFVDNTWRERAERPHDPGLSDDGKEQADHLAERMSGTDLDRIIASPFLRTVQTAHRVAEAAGCPVHLEPGLGEWQNARWFEGLADTIEPAELAKRFDTIDLDGPQVCLTPSFPETKEESLHRIRHTARCLVKRYRDASLLWVGHGITVQGVLRGLVGDVEDRGVPLASLTRLDEHDRGWGLSLRNDTAHLHEPEQASERLH